MGNFHHILAYVKYRFEALQANKSEFAHSLKKGLKEMKADKAALREIISLRDRLEKDNREIDITDYGAGSKHQDANKRIVGQIARYAGISRSYGTLLFDLMLYYKPKTIIELGTSVGLSTMYMAKACPEANIVSHEGCKQTAAIAIENFKALQIEHVKLVLGKFENTLKDSLEKHSSPDWIYLDGNHRKEPTLAYFEQCLQYINGAAILAFDDIHWSKEMEEAWEEIKSHHSVVRSVDLFKWGLIFVAKDQAKTKEHIVLHLL